MLTALDTHTWTQHLCSIAWGRGAYVQMYIVRGQQGMYVAAVSVCEIRGAGIQFLLSKTAVRASALLLVLLMAVSIACVMTCAMLCRAVGAFTEHRVVSCSCCTCSCKVWRNTHGYGLTDVPGLFPSLFGIRFV